MIKILNSKDELEQGFALRNEVFVLEQNVPKELEFDEIDKLNTTIHVGYFSNDELIGIARILDIDKKVLHIGRVAIAKSHRGSGIGRELILGCEEIATNIIKNPFSIELSAQLRAEKFYQNLGYTRINNTIYLDAGIEHIDMKKTIS